MARTTQAQGWARLLGTVAGDVVAVTVEDVHRAVTDAGFRWVGPLGRPVQQVHDAVTDRVHGLVQAGLRGMGEMAAAVVDRGEPGSERFDVAAVRAGAIAAGAIDGDLLAVAPELDLDVTLRDDGGMVVAPDPAGLAAAHPDPSGHVVVFVHGLVDTEAVWRTGNAPSQADSTADGGGTSRVQSLPERAQAAGATPLLVRYGTGRAVGRNGADLADLLERVVSHWPVPVVRLTLVTHSMGGLVARSACNVAVERGHAWTRPLHDVGYLGTPHLGAWLEKVANVVSWSLRHASPQSAPIGTLLDARSRGIKDLRFGALLEDGFGADAIDDLLSGRGAQHRPWLDHVTHHVVVGRLREDGLHPLNVLFGDTMVRQRSATGSGRWRRIPDGGEVRVAAIATPHSRLPTDPQVVDLVGDVLDAPTNRPSRVGAPGLGRMGFEDDDGVMVRSLA